MYQLIPNILHITYNIKLFLEGSKEQSIHSSIRQCAWELSFYNFCCKNNNTFIYFFGNKNAKLIVNNVITNREKNSLIV